MEKFSAVMAGGAGNVRRRLALAFIAVLLGSGIWLSTLHFWYSGNLAAFWQPDGVAPKVQELVKYQVHLWNNPEWRAREIQRMRGSNAEWDFMGRTFLVLALHNMCSRDPSNKMQYLEITDRIISETLALEKEHGMHFFLMDYSRGKDFLASPARSIFLDGEIALMLGSRLLVEPKAEFMAPFQERIRAILHQMEQGPVLCGESYPNECWMFCNTIALAAIKMHDVIENQDHHAFFQRWITQAKSELIHKPTGMLISSFCWNGAHGDGPEGTSLWLAAHMLQIIDADFAREQYVLGRKALARTCLGFGYASEWPSGHAGASDIDSGPIIPVLELSAGSTGLAFVGAAAFDDADFLQSLISSLEYGAFPQKTSQGLRYAASNQVGDAVLLYALTNGPLWKKIAEATKKP
jgi:hypothetical protein